MSVTEPMSISSRTFFKRMRLSQIRASAAAADVIAHRPAGRSCFNALRRLPGGVRMFDAILGHRRVYPTLADAQMAIAPFANSGHENPTNIAIHMDMSMVARPSDYAALFHLHNIIHEITNVYDVGGNAGNIYYCYSNYLEFRKDMKWIVYDLPGPIAYGRAMVAEKNVPNLEFTDDWNLASGTDLMLISGSLHYFEEHISISIKKLHKKPKYILINRSPLTDNPTVGAVQDVGDYHVACLLLNRDDLIQSLSQLGYELTDTWRCSELSFSVPANPAYNIGPYSGMLFNLA